eukprot:s337_g26.t1
MISQTLTIEAGGKGDDDDDFEDFSEVATPKPKRLFSEEQPEVVIISDIPWLRYKSKEIELPKPQDGGQWALECQGGTWTVTDGKRTKRVESLLALERARPWLVSRMNLAVDLVW